MCCISYRYYHQLTIMPVTRDETNSTKYVINDTHLVIKHFALDSLS
jgi:hypothetical protein